MAFLEVNFFSDALGMCMSMNVILPVTEEERRVPNGVKKGETYPTLYLLHGMSDDHTVWSRMTALERYAAGKKIAIVMPTTYLGWYTDMRYGYAYRKFIGEELPKICRSFFPGMSKKREDTYLAGNSMGGYGSLALALTYPDTFSLAAPFSGAFDPREIYREGDNYFGDIFGEITEFEGSKNDLYHLSAKRKEEGTPLPFVYMACGTEDSLLGENRRMKAHLDALGYGLLYREGEGGHDWAYWDVEIKELLDFIEKRREAN